MTTHCPLEALNAFVDDELEDEARRAVLAHLSGCSACRAHVAALRHVIAATRNIPAPAPPAALRSRVMAVVRADCVHGATLLCTETSFTIAPGKGERRLEWRDDTDTRTLGEQPRTVFVAVANAAGRPVRQQQWRYREVSDGAARGPFRVLVQKGEEGS